jgi:hypothetical protein
MTDPTPSVDPSDNVLDYASPRTRGESVSWVKVVVGTVLLLLVAGAILLILLPPLGKSGGVSPRVHCGINEHQILTCIFDYTAKNGGNTPASLQQLRASLPATSSSWQKISQCPAGSGAYVYVGQGLVLANAVKGTILLYEPPTNHKDPKTGKGAMNVAYTDGSVWLIVQPQAAKIIAELKAGHNPPRAEMIR